MFQFILLNIAIFILTWHHYFQRDHPYSLHEENINEALILLHFEISVPWNNPIYKNIAYQSWNFSNAKI